jgi:hypothetical protein
MQLARKAEIIEKERKRKANAATRIQSRWRGGMGRMHYKKRLPLLKREQQVRRFCVECEQKVAVRRCVQCKDRYCESCYQQIHKKGYRRGHSWEPLGNTLGLKDLTDTPQDKTVSRTATAGTAQTATAAAGGNAAGKAQWKEYFDAGAKAKYWFNTVTGEATWVCPY